MQPHSISAMAVAKHVWANKYGLKVPTSAEVQIDWTNPEGKSKHIFHYISQIEVCKRDSHNNVTGLKVTVKTTDGSPCTLTILRISDGEFKQGEKVIATHSVNHVAGLREIYELNRKSVRGIHRGSWRYGDYVCSDAGEGSFVLNCSVRIGSTNNFKQIPYKVTIRPKGEEAATPVLETPEEPKAQKGKILYFFSGKNKKAA